MASKVAFFTPCDFFVWAFVKDEVYTKQVSNIEELKSKIRESFGNVYNEMR